MPSFPVAVQVGEQMICTAISGMTIASPDTMGAIPVHFSPNTTRIASGAVSASPI